MDIEDQVAWTQLLQALLFIAKYGQINRLLRCIWVGNFGWDEHDPLDLQKA